MMEKAIMNVERRRKNRSLPLKSLSYIMMPETPLQTVCNVEIFYIRRDPLLFTPPVTNMLSQPATLVPTPIPVQ